MPFLEKIETREAVLGNVRRKQIPRQHSRNNSEEEKRNTNLDLGR